MSMIPIITMREPRIKIHLNTIGSACGLGNKPAFDAWKSIAPAGEEGREYLTLPERNKVVNILNTRVKKKVLDS